MSDNAAAEEPQLDREANRRWWLAGLMMLALVLNYSHRLVFSQNSSRFQETFDVQQAGYGKVTGAFSLGFAFGGPIWGSVADALPVRQLFPALVLLWSFVGGARFLVGSLDEFTLLQGLLGFLLAGHWPCSLRTTQRLFEPAQRTLANTILQAGSSVGNILTPLLILATDRIPSSDWRLPFLIVAALGPLWIIAWRSMTQDSDFTRPVFQANDAQTGAAHRELQEQPFWKLFLGRRWWLLLWTVITINVLWHYITAWLPDTLEKQHGYSRDFVQSFSAVYYVVTLLGSLVLGWMSSRLTEQCWSTTQARLFVFGVGSLLACGAMLAAWSSPGPLLLTGFLLVAAGSLSLFPVYYSLNQELSAKHQGKVGGLLSFCSWMILAVIHPKIGQLVQGDPSWRPWILTALGLAPLSAWLLLNLFWTQKPQTVALTGDTASMT